MHKRRNVRDQVSAARRPYLQRLMNDRSQSAEIVAAAGTEIDPDRRFLRMTPTARSGLEHFDPGVPDRPGRCVGHHERLQALRYQLY